MAIEHHGPSWREATVVDVGAGTGLLSVMCGKFARKVRSKVGGCSSGPWRSGAFGAHCRQDQYVASFLSSLSS